MKRMTYKRQVFNIKPEELGAILDSEWKFVWDQLVKRQEEGHDFEGDTYYLTASDLEQRIRAYAQEKVEGKPYGSEGRGGAYMYGPIIRTNIPRFDLLHICRSYLLSRVAKGLMQMHNFNRGHVSGARFRPAGEFLSPQEEATLAKQEKEKREGRPVHAKDPDFKGWPAKTLCSKSARKTVAKKGGGYSRGKARPSRFETESRPVTCKRCLKLLEEVKNV